MLETLLFYLLALAILLFGLGVILARSPIYSVLSLVAAMGAMAGLFVLLKAFLVAAILILVYAGAILVLFLFVVMMTDYRKFVSDWTGKTRWTGVFALGAGVLFFAQIFSVIRTLKIDPAATSNQGTARALGFVLFNQYVLPFELTSFLLLAAVVSVVVLAKKDAV